MQPPRTDLYGPSHKALRKHLYDVAIELAATDWRHEDQAKAVLARLGALEDILDHHANDEETFVHPALKAKDPGLHDELESEHRVLEASFRELLAMASEVEAAQGMQRFAMGNRLYLRYAKFVSDYTAHLNREETEVQPALWKHYSDDRLIEMRSKIQQRLSPEQFAFWGHMIWSSVSSFETLMMLRELKDKVPPEAFEAALAIAEDSTGDRWTAIKDELGV